MIVLLAVCVDALLGSWCFRRESGVLDFSMIVRFAFFGVMTGISSSSSEETRLMKALPRFDEDGLGEDAKEETYDGFLALL